VNSQNADAGASTYCPSTIPNFRFWRRNCVRTSLTASVISASNMTARPKVGGREEVEVEAERESEKEK
jgi:hypothetical protein